MKTLLYTLTALLIAGCASDGRRAAERDQRELDRALGALGVVAGERVTSVSNFRISGWRSVNDRHLILTAGRHEHYLVRLFAPCPELDFAFNIALGSRTGMLTPTDDVIVGSLHGTPERCAIKDIIRLVDREAP